MYIDLLLLILNPLFKYSSIHKIHSTYQDNLFKEIQILKNNWNIIRDEVLSSYKTYTTIKGDLFFNDIVKKKNDWKKLYIKWHSDIDKIAFEKCPKTCKIINSLKNIKIAMISVLSPNVKIQEHKGPYKGCLRYLLASCDVSLSSHL